MKEALFYTKSEGGIKCLLCPVGCVIDDDCEGFCKIRKNISGKLYAKQYGYITSIAIDPIEKKPLYHFRSGTVILSIGGYSCNMRCPFCQNFEISMPRSIENDKASCQLQYITPDELAGIAQKYASRGNIGVAYTYNEPFINYEYLLDCMMSVKERGMANVLVTNGYVNEEPLKKALPFIDAMNIDLKGERKFYTELKGNMDDVRRTIKIAADSKCHVEITTLIIPSKNDDPAEINEEAEWIKEISPDIPLHLSRFFPRYNMNNIMPTPVETLNKLRDIAKKHLKYVYIGNV